MKALYRYHKEATQAAENSGKSYRKTTCDAWDDIDEIKDEQLQRGGVSGEVNCYRTDEGDVFAWWEEDE